MKIRVLIFTCLIMILAWNINLSVYADDNSSGVVTLDSSGGDITEGSLQTRIEATGITDASQVIELHIGNDVSGELNTIDTDYINTMSNLKILNVADHIVVSDLLVSFFYKHANIQEATFPATRFGAYAFSSCSNLTKVTLPNATEFGYSSFAGSTALIDVSLPNASTFGLYAFGGCTGLTEISLPNALTFEDEAFYGCSALTSVGLPSVKTFGVQAFYECTSLTSISMPNAETFDSASFQYCTSLVSVSLPNVTSFEFSAFRYCSSLTSVDLSNVEILGTLSFKDCTSLVSVTLPKLTSAELQLFSGCTMLTSVSMPSVTSIGVDVFDSCTSLSTLTMGETVPSMGSFGSHVPIDGAEIHIPASAIHLYDPDGDGLWYGWNIVIRKFQVEFDSQFGSNIDGQSINDGDYISEPSAPSRNGYSFAGWFTDSSCSNGNWWNFEACPVTSDLTLYAKWIANSNISSASYTVTFDSKSDSYVSEQSVTEGDIVSEPDVPIKNGYTFAGWFTDDACSDGNWWNFNICPVTSNLTLYAKWIENSGSIEETSKRVTHIESDNVYISLEAGLVSSIDEVFSYIIYPGDAEDQSVTITSSNPSVASISEGFLTTYKEGRTIISIRANDTTNGSIIEKMILEVIDSPEMDSLKEDGSLTEYLVDSDGEVLNERIVTTTEEDLESMTMIEECSWYWYLLLLLPILILIFFVIYNKYLKKKDHL